MINFEPFAVESRCLHQDASQSLFSTSQCKISINGSNMFSEYTEVVSPAILHFNGIIIRDVNMTCLLKIDY